jgi:spore germination protein YaaH
MTAIDTNPFDKNRKRIIVSLQANSILKRNHVDVGQFILHLEALMKTCHTNFARVSRTYKNLQLDFEEITESPEGQTTLPKTP